MRCQIELHPVEVALSIGCTPEERASPQAVRMGLTVASGEKFPAARTDRLADTLDAAELLALIESVATTIRVQTLEALAERLETALRERFSRPSLEWRLSLHKPRYGWTYVQTWRS